ncbi:MAG: SH3 domain-containing protein, partial [Propionicimonas sp.]|nr:SH3 domain-containing protein [Propionicimonas sp.]
MSKVRAAISWAVTTAMLAGTAGIALSTSAGAATTVLAATVNVNIRSGPGTSNKILRTLQKGELVHGAGKVSGDWRPIAFDNTTAYVFAAYVTTAKTTTGPIIAGPAGTKKTTVNVNVRAKATLKSDIVKVLTKGAAVDVTGRASGAFSEVKVDGKVRWMYTAYLAKTSTPDPEPDSLPDIAGTFITTSLLAMRTSPDPNSSTLGDLQPNTTVGLTGKHEGSYSQIVHQGKVAWILSGYLKPTAQSGNITLPTSVGLLYVTASAVHVRA